jgi:hypothetical protein
VVQRTKSQPKSSGKSRKTTTRSQRHSGKLQKRETPEKKKATSVRAVTTPKNVGMHRLRIAHLRHGLRLNIARMESMLEATAPLLVQKKKKSISAEEIYSRFIAVLGYSDIDLNAPAGKYIRPGTPQVIRAFADVLNASEQFAPDKLALEPGDLANVKTIGDVGAAIIRWYQESGWAVTG